jgi:hypothetical protein
MGAMAKNMMGGSRAQAADSGGGLGDVLGSVLGGGGGGLGGALGNAMGGGGLGGALGSVLGSALGSGGAPQASAGGGGLLDMLTPMLDSNRNGSIADDVIGMLGKGLMK